MLVKYNRHKILVTAAVSLLGIRPIVVKDVLLLAASSGGPGSTAVFGAVAGLTGWGFVGIPCTSATERPFKSFLSHQFFLY